MLPDRIGAYRIETLLGKGGMGEVYRGWDEDLERPVAIKLIRQDSRENEVARRRFRREARTIAKLTHPAIVRIYHVQQWEEGLCIVMELIEGRTLRAILRDGPLPLERTLTLAHEITAALGVAHAEGIVHRDLKADNVMVTAAGHAKILDFGVAKWLVPGSDQHSLSVAGGVLGTFHSMSPEQARGQEIDYRSDLFALGVLLYEAVTGKAPFLGASAAETLARVCIHRQLPARKVNPQVPGKLSRLIDWLLEKEADDRPQSAEEVIAALETEVGPDSEATVAERPGPARAAVAESFLDSPTIDDDGIEGNQWIPALSGRRGRERRRSAAALAVVLAVVLAAVIGYLSHRLGEDAAPAPGTPALEQMPAATRLRPALAVLVLANHTGRPEADWVGTAIAELLSADLHLADVIRTIDGAVVAEAIADLGLSAAMAGLSPEERERMRRLLGADKIVLGSYAVATPGEKPLFRIDVRLLDASSGEIEAQLRVTATAEGLPEPLRRPAAMIRSKLGARDLTRVQRVALKSVVPKRPLAVRSYFEGLARLRRRDLRGARESLLAAVEAEPEHPLPHAALAKASSELGYTAEAREAAARAAERSGSLPRQRQLAIVALAHEIAGEWAQAVGTWAGLWRSFPDDPDYGLRLADAQIAADEYREALVSLDMLCRLPAPAGENPRIDYLRSLAHYRLSEFDHARSFAAEAARKAQALGAGLLLAAARLREGAALLEKGEREPARAALRQAEELFVAAADRLGSAQALELRATMLFDEGDLNGARRLFEQVLGSYRELGTRKSEARVLATWGTLLARLGRVAEGNDLHGQALAVYHQVGAKYEAAVLLGELGANLHTWGRLDAALEKYREALTLSDEVGDQYGSALNRTNIGEVQYLLGNLAEAQQMHREALEIARMIPDPAGEAYDTYRLGRISAARGDLIVARDRFESALREQTALGEVIDAEKTRIALAELALAEGRAGEAEALGGQAEQVLRTAEASDQAALAQGVVVRALLAQGRLREARAAGASVDAAAVASEDLEVRLASGITAALLNAAGGEETATAAALRRLEAIAAEAKTAGFVPYQLEARLAAGRIEQAAGRRTAARTRLEALAGEARDLGFLHVARQASRVREAGIAPY